MFQQLYEINLLRQFIVFFFALPLVLIALLVFSFLTAYSLVFHTYSTIAWIRIPQSPPGIYTILFDYFDVISLYELALFSALINEGHSALIFWCTSCSLYVQGRSPRPAQITDTK